MADTQYRKVNMNEVPLSSEGESEEDDSEPSWQDRCRSCCHAADDGNHWHKKVKETIPQCLLEKLVPDVVQEKLKQEDSSNFRMTLFFSAGKASMYAWCSWFLVLVLWLYSVIVTVGTMACPDEDVDHSFWDNQVWVGNWIISLVLVLAIILVGQKAFWLVAVPFASWCSSWKVFGCSCNFVVWWLWNSFVNGVMLWDVAASGVFLGKAMVYKICITAKCSPMEELWQHVLRRLTFSRHIPMAFHVHLASFLVLINLMIPLLMMAWPLASSMPLEEDWEFKVDGKPQGFEVLLCYLPDSLIYKYRMWHADALKSVAASARLVLITGRSHYYQMARAKFELERKPKAMPWRAMQIVLSEVYFAFPRFILYVFAYRTLVLGTMGVMLSLGPALRNAGNPHPDWKPGNWQLQLGVFVGFAAALQDVAEHFHGIQAINETFKRINDFTDVRLQSQRRRASSASPPDEEQLIKRSTTTWLDCMPLTREDSRTVSRDLNGDTEPAEDDDLDEHPEADQMRRTIKFCLRLYMCAWCVMVIVLLSMAYTVYRSRNCPYNIYDMWKGCLDLGSVRLRSMNASMPCKAPGQGAAGLRAAGFAVGA